MAPEPGKSASCTASISEMCIRDSNYSGYVGGLKEIPYRLLMEKKPELAMYEAIQGCLLYTSRCV